MRDSGSTKRSKAASAAEDHGLQARHFIFITREDIIGYGLPAYHIGRTIGEIQVELKETEKGEEMMCKEMDESFNEGMEMAVEQIAKAVGEPEHLVKEWIDAPALTK